MGTSSWLATTLDQEMLEVVRGVPIYPRRTPLSRMARQYGKQISQDLGGRYLLYYLRVRDVGRYTRGRTATTFVTPTPYSPEETVLFLALPRPTEPRYYVILIDPLKLPDTCGIYGPRWTALGPGIEYILEDGFTEGSIVSVPGAAPPWEVLVK